MRRTLGGWLVATFTAVLLSGCSIPYAIPWKTVEINKDLRLDAKSKKSATELLPEKIQVLRNEMERIEEKNRKRSDGEKTCFWLSDACAFLGIGQEHFREMNPRDVKVDLQFPENLMAGWTLQQLVIFLERMTGFREFWTRVTDIQQDLYLGFPKYHMEQHGYDQEVRIITDGDCVFNVITPGGILFPERRGEYWWKFSGDLFRGAVGGVGEQGGKETIRQGKKLIF